MKKIFLMLGCLLPLQMQAVNNNVDNNIVKEYANRGDVLLGYENQDNLMQFILDRSQQVGQPNIKGPRYQGIIRGILNRVANNDVFVAILAKHVVRRHFHDVQAGGQVVDTRNQVLNILNNSTPVTVQGWGGYTRINRATNDTDKNMYVAREYYITPYDSNLNVIINYKNKEENNEKNINKNESRNWYTLSIHLFRDEKTRKWYAQPRTLYPQNDFYPRQSYEAPQQNR